MSNQGNPQGGAYPGQGQWAQAGQMYGGQQGAQGQGAMPQGGYPLAGGAVGYAAYPQAPQGYGYPQGTGYGAMPPQQSTMFSPSTERFIKGALIGAAAAYVLTNPKVQHAVIKGSVRAWDFLQGGIEEVKERFRDAEAEVQAEKGSD
ncbi:uncharacterized membrane protein YebE (DUF533 family) [Rhodobium orientis]|uniref:YtxH domain-containing protein n=1 Tax=Rhodobium orientis TaxID=34017 RepID=A0A327JJC9_9HYPH|nr:hypothetical protein [Rhodobium orientis]MBB4305429.1 uncharacterized membrane protein YebE (DUF533 family) [Rhodobium orientis]MBK5948338.1 hypothetical protein [Rhodobium orientis]RAI25494.1 hypothetical protein CH339_17915 [Rhodobium orientis]